MLEEESPLAHPDAQPVAKDALGPSARNAMKVTDSTQAVAKLAR